MTTAIILAARKEKDSKIPYPLLPFYKNLCLIDRSLEILRELNFNKIFIVTGYKAEQFIKYEDTDVNLIVNNEYEFTSSMGSLALCKDFIDEDFILIEGDTFFENIIIKELSSIEAGNCLAVTEESGSGDECYVETKSGFVTKITKDLHRVCNFEGELIGVSRLSLSTFHKMVEEWEKSTNPYLNYEYLLMDVTDSLDRPYIFFKNVIWGDVDCKDDFFKLENYIYRALRRKENPYDKENLLQHLKIIFPNYNLEDFQISQIGGMSNKNFKVKIQGKSYILRVPGFGSDGMVERINEEFNSLLACKLGINPPIFYFDTNSGIKLAEFIENSETLNAATIQRHDNMRKIADIYLTLHNSHIRLKNEFNIFREIDKYDKLIEAQGVEMYDGWKEIKPQVLELENYLNTLGVDLKPCHNDALYENFLKAENGSIYLIDWEYSGMNDPMADFGALFIEAGFKEENEDYILNKYFKGSIPPEAKEKILCYQILWDYLWAQWTVIKEAQGDDFGSYGLDRFNRAISNLKKLKN